MSTNASVLLASAKGLEYAITFILGSSVAPFWGGRCLGIGGDEPIHARIIREKPVLFQFRDELTVCVGERTEIGSHPEGPRPPQRRPPD